MMTETNLHFTSQSLNIPKDHKYCWCVALSLFLSAAWDPQQAFSKTINDDSWINQHNSLYWILLWITYQLCSHVSRLHCILTCSKTVKVQRWNHVRDRTRWRHTSHQEWLRSGWEAAETTAKEKCEEEHRMGTHCYVGQNWGLLSDLWQRGKGLHHTHWYEGKVGVLNLTGPSYLHSFIIVIF